MPPRFGFRGKGTNNTVNNVGKFVRLRHLWPRLRNGRKSRRFPNLLFPLDRMGMFYCWQRFRNVGTVGNELATMIPHSKFAKEVWVYF